MSSQVISYRLSKEEVLQLRQKALPGESDNQTAQRLIRETLGMSTVSTNTFSLSTGSLDERIESILEERLLSLVSNQNDLLSRLQEVEAPVKKLPASNAPDVDKLKNRCRQAAKRAWPVGRSKFGTGSSGRRFKKRPAHERWKDSPSQGGTGEIIAVLSWVQYSSRSAWTNQ